MKIVGYSEIPNKSQFQTGFSVTLAFRSRDRILSYFDWLRERSAQWMAKPGCYYMRRVILSELFHACNSGVKGFHENGRRNHSRYLKERHPAVIALFESAVNRQCALFGWPRAGLPLTLMRYSDRELGRHGGVIDVHGLNAKILEGKAARNRRKLGWKKNGKRLRCSRARARSGKGRARVTESKALIQMG